MPMVQSAIIDSTWVSPSCRLCQPDVHTNVAGVGSPMVPPGAQSLHLCRKAAGSEAPGFGKTQLGSKPRNMENACPMK